MRRLFVCLVAAMTLGGPVHPAVAAPGVDALVVDFAGCEEHVGIELVDDELLADAVPVEFGLGFFGEPVPGKASLIVRTAACDTTIGGVDLGRVTTSQVGVITAVTDAAAVPGANAGIDNYTLFYVTDSRDFDRALSAAGVKMTHDERLELTIDRSTTTPRTAAVTAALHRQPRYELAGTQPDAVGTFGTFVADWWTDRGADRIRSRTTFPGISFGFGGEGAPGAVTLTTGAGSKLARLAAADQIVFDISIRGSVPTATLVVERAQIGAP